jgi:hypothetical protein
MYLFSRLIEAMTLLVAFGTNVPMKNEKQKAAAISMNLAPVSRTHSNNKTPQAPSAIN